MNLKTRLERCEERQNTLSTESPVLNLEALRAAQAVYQQHCDGSPCDLSPADQLQALSQFLAHSPSLPGGSYEDFLTVVQTDVRTHCALYEYAGSVCGLVRDLWLQRLDSLLYAGEDVPAYLLEAFGSAEQVRTSARWARQFETQHQQRMDAGRGSYSENYLLARKTVDAWLKEEECVA